MMIWRAHNTWYPFVFPMVVMRDATHMRARGRGGVDMNVRHMTRNQWQKVPRPRGRLETLKPLTFDHRGLSQYYWRYAN